MEPCRSGASPYDFDEKANKMVASERIKRAEAEEEAREVRLEREALRSALKIVEGENGRLRAGSVVDHDGRNGPSALVMEHYSGRFSHSRSSSQIAMKSPSSNPADGDPLSPITPHTLSAMEGHPALDDSTAEGMPSFSMPGSPEPLYVLPPDITHSPEMRANSPTPLPHPHRPSHLRSSKELSESDLELPLAPALLRTDVVTSKERSGSRNHPPEAPPPSAADMFSDSPWAYEAEEESGDSPRVYTHPTPDELASPWADR